jgi:hypothetical protein
LKIAVEQTPAAPLSVLNSIPHTLLVQEQHANNIVRFLLVESVLEKHLKGQH